MELVLKDVNSDLNHGHMIILNHEHQYWKCLHCSIQGPYTRAIHVQHNKRAKKKNGLNTTMDVKASRSFQQDLNKVCNIEVYTPIT